MIAGLLPTKDYDNSAQTFLRLRTLVDKIIVLDDNSTTPFPFANQCDIYLSMKRQGPWNCLGNRLLLLQMAYQLGCEWVVGLGHDMTFGAELHSRPQLDDLIQTMELQGAVEASFEFRELWDNIGHYRVDGVWKYKRVVLVQKNWLFDKGIAMPDPRVRLHSRCVPPKQLEIRPYFAPYPVYHLGSLTPALRQARVNKYKQEDPTPQFQHDYSYLANPTGAEFLTTPEQDLPYLV